MYRSDCFRISAACLGSEVKPESSWFLEHPWTEVRERAVVNDTTELEALDCPLAKHIANKVALFILQLTLPVLLRCFRTFEGRIEWDEAESQ